jgi:hypothetical protein
VVINKLESLILLKEVLQEIEAKVDEERRAEKKCFGGND